MISDRFGSHVFTLQQQKQRLTPAQFQQLRSGRLTAETADAVAQAMMQWALEQGATHYCHWFQPLTGATAEKHESFLSGTSDGQAILSFTGKQLILGESDASSFPTGGLRQTAYARGYTAWDMTSPVFIKEEDAGKILCIPTVFLSLDGAALDLKTPLLRAMEALDRQGRRITGLFGSEEGVIPLVGPEQEYFLVDQQLYARRPDLRDCGRTLFGAPAPKGQELHDQYFASIPARTGAFMQEVNQALWKLGVMAAVQHNEVAPGQHELAVRHCIANMAVDQNQLVMETMKRIAPRHGLVCLLHEKPYAGVNGSGKHNNWSLATESGENLLQAGADARFLLVLACVLEAIDLHADLLRVSAANAGNDVRLGGQEAPPAVISVYLGAQLQQLFEGDPQGNGQTLDTGIHAVPTFQHDPADRNRTTAIAFTGNKFEFRMVGASDSVAMANTVLCTAVADAFCRAADALEGSQNPDRDSRSYAQRLWEQHKRIVFNGDCYCRQWQEEAQRRNLPNFPCMVDAISALLAEKSVALFEKQSVFSRRELESRTEVLYTDYAKRIRIESQVMLHMTARDYLPAVIRYLSMLDPKEATQQSLREQICPLLAQLQRQQQTLAEKVARIDALATPAAVARGFREEVVPAMAALRQTVDTLETMVSRDCWPVPTYAELMYDV